jgi:hypothetical protein
VKLTRRKVIFVGLGGAAALAAGWAVFRSPSVPARGAALVTTHAAMLDAIAYSVLGPALPTEREARDAALLRTAKAIGDLIDQLPPTTREEIGQLFGLLSIKPARALLGYSGEWNRESAVPIMSFMQSLRHSSLALKQQTYFALHDLVYGSFYSEPSAWQGSGYPGPPKLA